MCGRFALYSEPSAMATYLDAVLGPDLADDADRWRPRWNVAPTGTVLGLSERDGRRVLDAYRWGLVPSWAKDPDAVTSTFNARGETVATKPMFRAAFKRMRILVAVDAFYEWAAGTPKQPYAFMRADGEPTVFAGLRETWTDHHHHQLHSATIITIGAGPDMPIHHRQPVVLDRGDWDRWLDPEVTDRNELAPLLRPTRAGTLVHHPIGREVGNVRNDGPGLLRTVTVTGGDGDIRPAT
jgi:putative SOS response-associated peptidase YedK